MHQQPPNETEMINMHDHHSSVRAHWLLVPTLALFFSAVAPAKENVIFRFNFTDGAYPEAALIADAKGSLYGAVSNGGHGCTGYGCGIVFELSPGSGGKWTQNVLYVFNGTSDGGVPLTNVIFDGKGNLYGGVTAGGANGIGGIYKLTRSPNGNWSETLIYSFTFQDGYSLNRDLVADAAGNLFGTLRYDGPAFEGSVFELSPQSDGTWKESIIYGFTGANGDGSSPYAGVVLDKQGNVYGTTVSGGTVGYGTVYQLSPNENGGWTENILYDFGYSNNFPESQLTLDTSGNLYGTTLFGGTYNGGTVFQMSQSSGQWIETVLYDFRPSPSDGSYPGGVRFGANGDLYGATQYGGSECNLPGCGTVFQLSPQSSGPWKETILYQFGSALDGSQSLANLFVDNKNERLYGVTEYGGGMFGYGTVFVIER
jgi:uncharacterized repeat protein (TIGR03803 family)